MFEIILQGGIDEIIYAEVNSQGLLIIENINPIPVIGKNLGEVKKLIKK